MQYTFQDWLPDILGRESGNDPNALFGFRNRGDGQFGDTRVSEMTLDEVINFTKPSGPYAQSVKNQIGYVATPTGLGQIVGQTMRGMKDEMGLTGSEMYNEDLQLAMAEQIYNRQGKNAWEALHGMSAPSGMAMPTGISGGGGANYNPRAKRRMAKGGFNMMQDEKQQPQGILGRMTSPSESTGLNFFESFAAGLDPLIMPSMRGGAAIRERGDKLAKTMKSEKQQNKSIQYLMQNGHTDLAQAVQSGVLSGKDAMAYILKGSEDTRTGNVKDFEYLSKFYPQEKAAQMVFGNVGTAANVDMGRGLQLTYDKDGKPIIENIEGGAAALAEAERIAKKQTSESSSKSTARMINSNINDIRDIYNESSVLNPAFGIGANFAERIGGSNSANVAALLKPIKANIGFGALSKMRAQSPTGGALGNVSNIELELLTSTLQSVEQSQSGEQAMRAFDDLENYYNEVIHGPQYALENWVGDKPAIAQNFNGIDMTDINANVAAAANAQTEKLTDEELIELLAD